MYIIYFWRILFLGKVKCVLNCVIIEGDIIIFGNVKDGILCIDKLNSGLCVNG